MAAPTAPKKKPKPVVATETPSFGSFFGFDEPRRAFPVEVPVFSVSESGYRPTAMLFRNLAAMAVEETIRGQPIDGVVLHSPPVHLDHRVSMVEEGLQGLSRNPELTIAATRTIEALR